jgi:hypothetical protein
MMAEAAVDQKLGTLLRLHEEAFRQLGGVPEEILWVWKVANQRLHGRTRPLAGRTSAVTADLPTSRLSLCGR